MTEKTMDSRPLKVLVVSAGRKESNSLQRGNRGERFFKCDRISIGRLEETLQQSGLDGPGLILLDFELSKADLAKTLERIRDTGRRVPVLVFPGDTSPSACADTFLERGLCVRGASGRAKDQMTHSLFQALRRRQLQSELSRMALSDELTGLYNRRGFLIHGSEYLKRACRLKKNLLVFYADLDNLKQINDQFGHQEGDRALVRIAGVFKKTFRSSDITARFGGDEFTTLVVEDSRNSAETISRRLRRNLDDLAANERRYRLSLSFGIAQSFFKSPAPLHRLLRKADRSLYEQKRIHHSQSSRESVVPFPGIHWGENGRQCNGHRTKWFGSSGEMPQKFLVQEG